MDPMMMGNGDVMGDGELGPQNPAGASPEDMMAQEQVLAAEASIKQTLIQDAYGAQTPARRTVDKE
jgi:hypothetical protein